MILPVSLWNILEAVLPGARMRRPADAARGYYERSLEVCERLLKANPESAQAARDVSVSLGRLGDFLASRGQAGDATKALG